MRKLYFQLTNELSEMLLKSVGTIMNCWHWKVKKVIVKFKIHKRTFNSLSEIFSRMVHPPWGKKRNNAFIRTLYIIIFS